MRKIAILTAFSALAVAVAGLTLRDLPARPAQPETTPLSAPDRTLDGHVLHQSDALGAPAAIAVAGRRLVVAEAFADPKLRVLRRTDGAVERSFGRTGRGPREFETVTSIDVIDPAGRLLVHDPMLQRVTWIDLERDFDGERWTGDRSVRLDASAMVLAAGWTPDGLIGLGSFTNGRLVHMGHDGRLREFTGAPAADPGGVRREVWVRSYQGRIKPRPDRKRWVLVSRFADRLEIYDADGRHLATGDRPYDFDPEDLEEEDTGAVRFGYIDVATTDSRIYALFSGRRRAEGDANFGGRIHVFDWGGRLLEVWGLNSRLIALAAAPEGEALYGVRHDPLPAVLVYPLD